MNTIDDIDAKILENLFLDGRKSLVEIAKECKVSAITLGKRFNNLKKKGVIVGSTLQINYQHLGFDFIVSVTISIDSEQMKPTFEKIRRMKNLYVLTREYSEYNAHALFTFRNSNELDKAIEELRQLRSILNFSVYLWTSIRNQPQHFELIKKKKPINHFLKNPTLNNTEPKTENYVDEMDLKIIDKLSENSRLSFREISKELGIATDTVSRRYERLKQNGTIKAIIQVNPQALGYHAFISLAVKLSKEAGYKDTIEELSKVKNCIVILSLKGGKNYLGVEFLIRDLEELFEIRQKVGKIPHTHIIEITIARCGSVFPRSKEQISTM